MSKEINWNELRDFYNSDLEMMAISFAASTSADLDFIVDGQFRIKIFDANAAECTHDEKRNDFDHDLHQALKTDSRLRDSLQRKMHNLSEATEVNFLSLEQFSAQRPTAIFIFLTRNINGEELLVIVEGLVVDKIGRTHKDLRKIPLVQSLTKLSVLGVGGNRQRNVGGYSANAMRSGHNWGNIILLDRRVEDIDPFDQKIIRILQREGTLVIDTEANPYPQTTHS